MAVSHRHNRCRALLEESAIPATYQSCFKKVGEISLHYRFCYMAGTGNLWSIFVVSSVHMYGTMYLPFNFWSNHSGPRVYANAFPQISWYWYPFWMIVSFWTPNFIWWFKNSARNQQKLLALQEPYGTSTSVRHHLGESNTSRAYTHSYLVATHSKYTNTQCRRERRRMHRQNETSKPKSL